MSKLVEINWNPTDRQIRQFGGLAVVALPLLAWMWGLGGLWFGVLTAIGCAAVILGFVAPQVLKPLFVALSVLTAPIGMVVSYVILVLLYYGLFFPMAVIFRLMHRDQLQRALDRSASTYWQPKEQPRGAKSYFRQW